MQKFNIIYFLKSLKSIKNTSVITKKFFIKFFGKKNNSEFGTYLDFLKTNSIDFQLFSKLDPEIWLETQAIAKKINDEGKDVLNYIEYDLGGGGSVEVVYFLTRLIKPNNIIETGVAAGFTTYAFLKAIEKNKKGNLYSSDFPYFRLPNAEQFIGIIIPASLKKKWNLYINGDENNIKEIKKRIKSVDLVHYDSDKTYEGRKNFLKSISTIIHKDTFIIMDDLHDNTFFYDLISKDKNLNWKIVNIKKNNSIKSYDNSIKKTYIGIIYPDSFEDRLK